MKKYLATVLLLWSSLCAAQYTPIITTPGSADTAPQGAAKINTQFQQLYSVGGINRVALSTYTGSGGVTCGAPGVTTGLIDSKAAVVAAFAAVAGTNKVLVVDCPVFIHMGLGSAYSIFVASGTNLEFTSQGQFIIDDVGAPAFVFENASNITWKNTNLLYIGAPGLVDIMFFPNFPVGNSFYGLYASFQNTTVTNYLTANNGNTFTSGGVAISNGQTNANFLIQIRGGCNNLNFIGGNSIAQVPAGATAASFIPGLVSFGPDWNAGVTGITSSTTVTTSNASGPSNITFDGWTIDGYVFGFQGNCSNCFFRNIRAYRYSDLEDGTSGTVTFSGTLSGGATTGTLATAWPLPTASYGLGFPLGAITGVSGSAGVATVTFSGGGTVNPGEFVTIFGETPNGYNGTFVVTSSSAGSVSFANGTTGSQTVAGTVYQVLSVPLTQGQTSTGAFITRQVSGAFALGSLANATSSAVAISGNPGGVGTWFSPPHLFYMNVSSFAAFPFSIHASDIIDYGQYVGVPIRRSVISGTSNSLKIALEGDTSVERYTTYKPDGIGDILVGSGGIIRDLYGSFNSSLLTADSGNSVWGLRFPSNTAYQNIVGENITLKDTATVPTQYPMGAIVTPGSNNISIRGLKVFVNDWPTGATYNPGIDIQGNRINVQADLFFNTANSSQTGRGAMYSGNSAIPFTTNSNFDINVHGWRNLSLTFTAGLSSGATTGALLNAFGGFTTGTYQITFSDGEIRYATLTANTAGTVTFTSDGSTTLALTGNVTANATVIGTLNTNYAQYKQRIILGGLGLNTGNHGIVRDVTNGWEGIYEDGLQTEHYTQMWRGAPTGATFTTPMVFPSTMAIDAIGPRITTNLDTSNGLTTYGVGCTGSPTAFLSVQLATTSFTPVPAFAPITTCGSNPILLTPTAGSFGTTGNLQLSVRGTQMLGAN